MGNQTKTLAEYSKVLFLNRVSTKRECSLLRRTRNSIFNWRIVERRARGLRARRWRLRRLVLWHSHRSLVASPQNNRRVIASFGFCFSLQISFAGLRICTGNLPDCDSHHLTMAGQANWRAGVFAALGRGIKLVGGFFVA